MSKLVTKQTAQPGEPAVAVAFIGHGSAKLRPVVESDLPAMARIMAEAPLGFSWDPTPWTTQRLKKTFEDEKEPGMWGRATRYYVVTNLSDELCGVFKEEQNRLGCVELTFHIAVAASDREVLGRDALRAYVDYKQGWNRSPRIMVTLLEIQQSERDWIEELGFQLEVRCEQAWLHLGEFTATETYAWLAEWVLANRAADGIGV
jgi:hypothetical protein